GQGWRALAHRECNRSHGGRLGNTRRRKGKKMLDRGAAAIGCEITIDRTRTWVAIATVLRGGQIGVELEPAIECTDSGGLIAVLAATVRAAAVAFDPKSAAATLIPPLKTAGVSLALPGPNDLALATGWFFDAHRSGVLRTRRQRDLREAIAAAEPRKL